MCPTGGRHQEAHRDLQLCGSEPLRQVHLRRGGSRAKTHYKSESKSHVNTHYKSKSKSRAKTRKSKSRQHNSKQAHINDKSSARRLALAEDAGKYVHSVIEYSLDEHGGRGCWRRQVSAGAGEGRRVISPKRHKKVSFLVRPKRHLRVETHSCSYH